MSWLNKLWERGDRKTDEEVRQFRDLMSPPETFEQGFSWKALFGALFIGLIMVPGAIYMGLLAGETNVGPAAQWVTVILFIEAARRAHQSLKKAEIFILFYMAGIAMGMPFTGLLWNQYYVRSDPAIASGISELLPVWFAPGVESESYSMRTFMHWDWLPVIGLLLFTSFFSQLSNMILGYGLFRLTSDIEKLPFPMAPVGAQGVTALAEDADESAKEGGSWRWRVFSIGGALGLIFGAVYLGIPTLTGIFLDEPLHIFPIPWVDLTDQTDTFLPAVATGISWDVGNLIIGMVLPFYAMVGSMAGLLITVLANPFLYANDVLTTWKPGDDTVSTVFANNVDFYFSFQIGVSLAIAIVGFINIAFGVKQWRRKRAAGAGGDVGVAAKRLKERGDIRPWLILLCYLFVTTSYIVVSGFLVDWHRGVMIALIFFGFLYTPLISYVTARLEGLAGQIVEIPMVREAALIFSGYKGVAVWFLPLPIANYGQMTVFYRQAELTGTRFSGIWKSNLFLYPIILVCTIIFASFIWSMAEVPSPLYPYASTLWELEAKNRGIIYSATLGEYSVFEEAFDFANLGWGFGFGVALFALFEGIFGLPIFFTYGVVRGLGQSLPHMIIPQFIGALIGRIYFQKKMGLKWRQYIPVVAAGFACGQGLITTACVGLNFLSRAAIDLPF